MTDTPMTPDREQEIRYWHKELAGLTNPTQAALRAAFDDLLAEVDRLRARVAELEESRAADQAERSRWTDAEAIVEHARDKGCDQIDTDLLFEALGLDQS